MKTNILYIILIVAALVIGLFAGATIFKQTVTETKTVEVPGDCETCKDCPTCETCPKPTTKIVTIEKCNTRDLNESYIPKGLNNPEYKTEKSLTNSRLCSEFIKNEQKKGYLPSDFKDTGCWQRNGKSPLTIKSMEDKKGCRIKYVIGC